MTENLNTRAATIVLATLTAMLGPSDTVSAQKMETRADGIAKDGVTLRGGRHGDRDDWTQLRASLYGD